MTKENDGLNVADEILETSSPAQRRSGGVW